MGDRCKIIRRAARSLRFRLLTISIYRNMKAKDLKAELLVHGIKCFVLMSKEAGWLIISFPQHYKPSESEVIVAAEIIAKISEEWKLTEVIDYKLRDIVGLKFERVRPFNRKNK